MPASLEKRKIAADEIPISNLLVFLLSLDPVNHTKGMMTR